MSNWGSEATNNETVMSSDLQWKVKVKLIEENLRKLKQEADNTAQKFIWVKANNGSYDGLQNWIHTMTKSCNEMTSNMDDLKKMISQTHNHEYVVKNSQLKQMSKSVENQMKHIQNLSSEIQKEMERNYTAKKMAISMASTEKSLSGDNVSGYESTNQFQMNTVEDSQLQQALEEQQQCEKLLRDIVQIESLIVKVADLIHEQDEVIIKIETNVAEALDKTEEGVTQLKQAVDLKQSSFKKKICIIGIIVTILIAIALVIGLSVHFGK